MSEWLRFWQHLNGDCYLVGGNWSFSLVCCFKAVRRLIYFRCLSSAFGCCCVIIFLASRWCSAVASLLFFFFCWNLLAADELKWTSRSSEFYRFTREHAHGYRSNTIPSWKKTEGIWSMKTTSFVFQQTYFTPLLFCLTAFFLWINENSGLFLSFNYHI